jgi:hypothetical protein
MSETDFHAEARAAARPPGNPCSIGVLLVRLRSENPPLARGLEDAMADQAIPASAISHTLGKYGHPDVPAQRINHHRFGRCRHCPAKTA